MRDYDNFEQVFTFKHLQEAYKLCCRGVSWKPSVQNYKQNHGLNIYRLYERIHSGKFKSRGFYEFTITERGKTRQIKSVTITERVLQRCLCDYCLVPALSRSLIYDNGASLQGKGYSFAIQRMETHLHRYYGKHGAAGYIARFDIRKYFDSIPHDLVERILKKNLTDRRLIRLTMQLVKDFGSVGLGLGSQVSQILAVAALNEMDHYIKDGLGMKYYGRYMDDFYIIHNDKAEVEAIAGKVAAKVEDLGFHLNQKKSKIRKINNTEFLKIKWFLTPEGKIVKKPSHESYIRMRRKLKKFKKMHDEGRMSLHDIYTSWQSWNAYMGHSHSHRYRIEILHLAWELFGKKQWKGAKRCTTKQ